MMNTCPRLPNREGQRTSWSSSMTVCMSWLRKAGGVMLRSSRAVAYRSACRSHGVCRASCGSDGHASARE